MPPSPKNTRGPPAGATAGPKNSRVAQVGVPSSKATRVFPAGTGGNPASPQIGSISNLNTTAQPPIRPPPDPFVQKSVEPFTDDDAITGFVDGAGNRIWHVDTSASAKAITFVSAAESVDYDFVVKWVRGANGLKIVAATGNVGGTTTFVGVVFGDAYSFRSDGTEYHLVAQATNQGFLTSNSFSAFTASGSFTNLTVSGSTTVSGSATFSGTVAFLTSINVSGTASIGTLVVSGTASFSGTVVMNSLKVLGSATFSSDVYVHGSLAVSATLSVGVAGITVGGVPLSSDVVKITATAISNVLIPAISGSWTAYSMIDITGFFTVSSSVADEAYALGIYLSTDGGTSRFLDASTYTSSANEARMMFNAKYIKTGNVHAIQGMLYCNPQVGGTNFHAFLTTLTANAGIVNQIGIYHTHEGATLTLSNGIMLAYGYK